MLATSNSQERDEYDWRALLKNADSDLSLAEVGRTLGAKLYLIVAR
jgi:hypothetical protein